jgi:hypothetical protein
MYSTVTRNPDPPDGRWKFRFQMEAFMISGLVEQNGVS